MDGNMWVIVNYIIISIWFSSRDSQIEICGEQLIIIGNWYQKIRLPGRTGSLFEERIVGESNALAIRSLSMLSPGSQHATKNNERNRTNKTKPMVAKEDPY